MAANWEFQHFLDLPRCGFAVRGTATPLALPAHVAASTCFFSVVNIQIAIENGDFNGIYIVIQWNIHGIYPLVMTNIAIESGDL